MLRAPLQSSGSKGKVKILSYSDILYIEQNIRKPIPRSGCTNGDTKLLLSEILFHERGSENRTQELFEYFISPSSCLYSFSVDVIFSPTVTLLNCPQSLQKNVNKL
jgi:hypothetical protein